MTKELVAQPECEYAPPMYGNCPNKEHPVPGRTYTVRIHCQHFDDKVDDPEEAGRGFVADVSIHTNVNGVEVMQAAVRRLWEKIIACNEQVDTQESDGIMVPC